MPEYIHSELIKKAVIDQHHLLHFVPSIDSALLIPHRDLKAFPIFEHIHQMNWDNEISRILVETFPAPSTPWFSENTKPLSLVEAQNKLSEECLRLQGTKSKKGRDVEKIVKEILLEMGVVVEANVSILGSEIDLLLCKYDKYGRVHYYIIELKYRQSKATVSQVMRLFGLQEALRRHVEIENSVIANVAGFTKPASSMIKHLRLSGLALGELFEWVDFHGLNQGKDALPFVKTEYYDENSRHCMIPEEIMRKLGYKAMLIGAGSYLELWCEKKWFQYMDDLVGSDQEVYCFPDELKELVL
ncbi:MAG: restriction endonuclease [Pseudomonadota bacterium]|nr:restriction endonuclease [Pseudomonadota bacterium]